MAAPLATLPARRVLEARPLLVSALLGAALGALLIHPTAAFTMDPQALRDPAGAIVDAYAPAAAPLLAYHVAMGALVGLGAGALAARLFRDRLREEARARELESQLHRSQRLESIGRVAAGVAHDFNNLLTAIGLNLWLARESADDPEAARRFIDDAKKATDKAAQMPRQLLAFARRQPSEPRIVETVGVVKDIEKIMQRLVGETVRIEARYDSDGRVRIDPGQLEQVLVNLAVNARDAMPQGGRLSITVDEVTLGARTPGRPAELADGRYQRICVSDTGVGIGADVIERVFEPFFTTKTETKGTGLGLSTCYGIARQNGGAITVSSQTGQGATFALYLPLTEAPATPPDAAAPEADHRASSARILLVDDQPHVRDSLAQVLRAHGYEVVTAADGAEAMLRLGDAPVDAVVTDVVMPGIGGTELAELVRKDAPAMPILFVTGHPQDHAAALRAERLLVKPFRPDALLSELDALLLTRQA